MPFKLIELQEFLLADPEVKILIVEGRSDVEFWQDLVPIIDRENCVVYSIEEIDILVGVDGNKGAALYLADSTCDWTGGDRIRYFLDADNDNLLDVDHGQHVVLTDFRDMEAYSLVDEVFSRLCKSGACENDNEYIATKTAVTETVRRVGLLRLASARSDLKLPFQETFQGGSLSRFMRKKGKIIDLKIVGMIDALSHNAGMDFHSKSSVHILFSTEEATWENTPDVAIVHGKDLSAFIAWHFKVPLDIATGMIRLALVAEIELIRMQPRLKHVEQWVRAA